MGEVKKLKVIESKGPRVWRSKGPRVQRTKISQKSYSNTSLTLKKDHLVFNQTVLVLDILHIVKMYDRLLVINSYQVIKSLQWHLSLSISLSIHFLYQLAFFINPLSSSIKFPHLSISYQMTWFIFKTFLSC